MSSHLFVYGSLMGTIQSNMATLLHENADFLGSAKVQGRLYDLGAYPGLVLDAAGPAIEGHVFTLHHPEALLAYLDQYEGILPDNPNGNEYERELITVIVKEAPLTCWAYIYQRATNNLPIINYTNYLDYLKDQPNHLKFLDGV